MAETPAMQRMQRARTSLIIFQPFFGSLIMRLKLVESPDIKTMATDYKNLFFNPAWTMALKDAGVLFVTCHEVLHNAYRHSERLKFRDHMIFNIAADYAINRDLKQGGIGEMPERGFYDAKYDGMSAEDIYEDLIKNAVKVKAMVAAGPDGDPGGCGAVLPPATGDAATADADEKALAAEWDQAVREALAVARQQNAGKTPAHLKRLADMVDEPKVDWREALRRFIDSTNRKDFSWLHPNKRYGAPLIMPGYRSEGIAHVVLAVDTSGSIDDRTLSAFATEIRAAIHEGNIEKVTVVYADARVAKVDVFDNGEDFRVDAAGGGGTDFRDTFDWIGANASDAAAVIYFTDLYVSEFGDPQGLPVMWAVYGPEHSFKTNSSHVSFGECLHING